jgi:hypothetical protein
MLHNRDASGFWFSGLIGNNGQLERKSGAFSFIIFSPNFASMFLDNVS